MSEHINFAIIDSFFKRIHFDIDCLKEFKKIYCLVSGGMDSTLLAEYLFHHYPEKVWFVNCYNPYETSETLSVYTESTLGLIIKPNEQYNYGEILKSAFLKLNEAAQLREEGKYQKHIFQCCAYIKHKAFLDDPLFKEEGTVVISGIKAGDGQQRRFFLNGLRNCVSPGNHQTISQDPTFFYHHKGGQLYCYPYRDYTKRELPKKVIAEVKKKFPTLKHSGYAICPVVLLFGENIKQGERERGIIEV